MDPGQQGLALWERLKDLGFLLIFLFGIKEKILILLIAFDYNLK